MWQAMQPSEGETRQTAWGGAPWQFRQAESVARGRCRALVRIPWDDHLSLDRAPRNELRALRAPTRKAYIALGGVVAGGLVQMPERYRQQEVSR